MGDMADDAMMESIAHELYLEHKRELLEEKAKAYIESYKMGIAAWKTQGQEIPVIKMTNDHIHNTIKFLKRKPKKSAVVDAWIYILETEETKRQQQKES